MSRPTPLCVISHTRPGVGIERHSLLSGSQERNPVFPSSVQLCSRGLAHLTEVAHPLSMDGEWGRGGGCGGEVGVSPSPSLPQCSSSLDSTGCQMHLTEVVQLD